MDYPNHITNRKKGKHLTYEDYVVIELRLKGGWTPNTIAKKELHCAANTVHNIIKKGMTPLYNCASRLRPPGIPRKPQWADPVLYSKGKADFGSH